MPEWNLCPFTVTPAASLLSKCVSGGVLKQEEIDAASSNRSHAFSSQLVKAEEQIKMRRELDQLQLETELLREEKKSADITHSFFLAQRFQMLQQLCSHLQDVLKNQTQLRQRLMRPVGGTNLPIRAHLHRPVVDSVKMLLDFIEALEEKLSALRSRPAAGEHLDQLNTSLAQLLALASEMETVFNQLLHWKEVRSSLLSDNST